MKPVPNPGSLTRTYACFPHLRAFLHLPCCPEAFAMCYTGALYCRAPLGGSRLYALVIVPGSHTCDFMGPTAPVVRVSGYPGVDLENRMVSGVLRISAPPGLRYLYRVLLPKVVLFLLITNHRVRFSVLQFLWPLPWEH